MKHIDSKIKDIIGQVSAITERCKGFEKEFSCIKAELSAKSVALNPSLATSVASVEGFKREFQFDLNTRLSKLQQET